MRSVIIAAILSVSAVTAYAGDLDAPQGTPDVAPPASVQDTTSWAGFYGGLSYSSVSGGINENPGGGVFPDLNGTGAVGGFIGYNWQNDNFVYGAELNHTALETNYVGFPTSIQDSVTEVRARLGYTPMNALLVYGFVGYASSKLNDAGTVIDQSGVSYGLGVDYMVWRNMFVGLELAHRDVDGVSGANRLGSDIDTVSLRVGYKF